MKRLVVSAASAVLLALSASAASAQAGGSYLATCYDVRQNGPILSAMCDDGSGRVRPTRIDIRQCGRGDIANAGGRLVCSRPRYRPEPRYYDGRPRAFDSPDYYQPRQPRYYDRY
jgi:hypothetical protein